MKYVVLNAYTEKNLGDDLFIRYIINRYSNTDFYVLNNSKYKYVFDDLKNLKFLDLETNVLLSFGSKIYRSLIPNIKGLIEKKANAVVYIGGSLFIEYENWREISNWWDYQASNHKFYVLGSNFGPYNFEDFKKRYDEIFSKCQDVCVRDQYSYNLFKENNKVRYAPDILLSYKIPKIELKKQIFISVINCETKDEGSNKLYKYQNDYIALLLKIINQYLDLDYKIVLSSFCEKEGDNKAIELLINKIENTDNIEVLNYDGLNYNDILKGISASSYVIGSRFHSVILALAAKRPVLPIIYSNKTKNVLEDMSFKGNVIDIRNIDKDISFEEIDSNRSAIQDMDHYIKKAEEHFSILDKNLK